MSWLELYGTATGLHNRAKTGEGFSAAELQLLAEILWRIAEEWEYEKLEALSA